MCEPMKCNCPHDIKCYLLTTRDWAIHAKLGFHFGDRWVIIALRANGITIRDSTSARVNFHKVSFIRSISRCQYLKLVEKTKHIRFAWHSPCTVYTRKTIEWLRRLP